MAQLKDTTITGSLNVSGNINNVTQEEFKYLSGVTSNIQDQFTELNTNLNNRCITFLPYYNNNKDSIVNLTANQTTYIFCKGLSTNGIINVITNVGEGQYLNFKKVGLYRITLHVASNNSSDFFVLSLKDSGNSTMYKESHGYSKQSIEILYYVEQEQAFLLQLKSSTAVTLYSDPKYSWIEFEYLGI